MAMRIIDSMRKMREATMRVNFSTLSSFTHSHCSDRYCFISAMTWRREGVGFEVLISESIRWVA